MEILEHREYWDALKRLKDNKSKILPKGTLICNDSVSLEAGRKKGSIKKSRPSFGKLVEAIKEARENQKEPESKTDADVKKYKALYHEYRKKHADALARELRLIERLTELESDLEEIKERGL